jgi:hypothetical protein
MFFVDLITILWKNVGRENPCRGSHPRRRRDAKVIFQRRIGRMKIKDCGSRTRTIIFSLIVVRVVIGLKIFGHFIHNFVQIKTGKM